MRVALTSLLFSWLFLLGGCGEADEDFIADSSSHGSGGLLASPTEVATESTDEDTYNILLEDYTGIRCSNCPMAAEEIARLQELYGDRLIPVAIHAGNFARPMGEQFDLRSEAGNVYNDYFKVKANPSGIVNRMDFSGVKVLGVNKWESVLAEVPKKTTVVIKSSVYYQEADRKMTVKVGLKNLSEVPANYSMILWLIEDNIVTVQAIATGGVVDDYVQRHVLRGALNGTWGEQVNLPVTTEYVELEAKEYVLPDIYKERDCYVVVLICKEDTKEVIQVEEVQFTRQSCGI